MTPTRRLEFLLGKQLPYVVMAMLNFLLLAQLAVTAFGVPLKGSFPALAAATLLYVSRRGGWGSWSRRSCAARWRRSSAPRC